MNEKNRIELDRSTQVNSRKKRKKWYHVLKTKTRYMNVPEEMDEEVLRDEMNLELKKEHHVSGASLLKGAVATGMLFGGAVAQNMTAYADETEEDNTAESIDRDDSSSEDVSESDTESTSNESTSDAEDTSDESTSDADDVSDDANDDAGEAGTDAGNAGDASDTGAAASGEAAPSESSVTETTVETEVVIEVESEDDGSQAKAGETVIAEAEADTGTQDTAPTTEQTTVADTTVAADPTTPAATTDAASQEAPDHDTADAPEEETAETTTTEMTAVAEAAETEAEEAIDTPVPTATEEEMQAAAEVVTAIEEEQTTSFEEFSLDSVSAPNLRSTLKMSLRRAPAKTETTETQYKIDGSDTVYTEKELITKIQNDYKLEGTYNSLDDVVLAAYKSVKVNVDELNQDFKEKVLDDKMTTTDDSDLDEIIKKAQTVVDTYTNKNGLSNSFEATYSPVTKSATVHYDKQASVTVAADKTISTEETITDSAENTISETNASEADHAANTTEEATAEYTLTKTTTTDTTNTLKNLSTIKEDITKTVQKYTYLDLVKKKWYWKVDKKNATDDQVKDSYVGQHWYFKDKVLLIQLKEDNDWYPVIKTETKTEKIGEKTEYSYDVETTTNTATTYSAQLYNEEEYSLADKILGWAKLLKESTAGNVKALMYTLKDENKDQLPAFINEHLDVKDSEIQGRSTGWYEDAYSNHRNAQTEKPEDRFVYDDGTVTTDTKIKNGKNADFSISYNILREYAQAMYEGKNLTVEQALTTTGTGKHEAEGASLTQTGENAIVFYHYDTSKKTIEGEAIYTTSVIEDGKQVYHYYRVVNGKRIDFTPIEGDVYYAGYVIKHSWDGYHIDGTLNLYAEDGTWKPVDNTPDPSENDDTNIGSETDTDKGPEIDSQTESTSESASESETTNNSTTTNYDYDDADDDTSVRIAEPAVLGDSRAAGNVGPGFTAEPAVLGVSREPVAAEQAVLGASRTPEATKAVLNANRDAATGDMANLAGEAAGVIGGLGVLAGASIKENKKNKK